MFHAREVESSPFDGPEVGDRDEGEERLAADGLEPDPVPDGVSDFILGGRATRPDRCTQDQAAKRDVRHAAIVGRSCPWAEDSLVACLRGTLDASGHLGHRCGRGCDVGGVFPFGGFAPAFGAASAVYAVQLTVRTSVLDGAKRTVLMGLSVFLAVVILRIVGLSASR